MKLLSIVIPISGESSATLDNLYDWIVASESTYGEEQIEWIVSLDDTDSTLQSYKDSKLSDNVLVDKIRSKSDFRVTTSSKGRGIQMNEGAKASSGDILLFLHCDTRLDNGWLEALIKIPRDWNWGAFSPAIEAEGLLFRIAERFGKFRSRTLSLPYGDQAIFVERSLFEKSGGYCQEILFMEDLHLSERLAKIAGEPRILDCRAITSGRRWQDKDKHPVNQSIKNLLALAAFKSGLGRDKIESWYRS